MEFMLVGWLLLKTFSEAMSNAAFKNLKQNLLKIQGWELEKFMRKNTKKTQKSTKNPNRKKTTKVEKTQKIQQKLGVPTPG